MHKSREFQRIAVAVMASILLYGCNEAPTRSASASASPLQVVSPEAGKGDLQIGGDWQGEFSSLVRGSKLETEPFQETFGLRVDYAGGGESYPGALFQVGRLPALESGEYGIGADGELRGTVSLHPPNPGDTSPLFNLESGRLVLKIAGGKASGSFQATAEERIFDRASRRHLEISGTFEGVAVKE